MAKQSREEVRTRFLCVKSGCINPVTQKSNLTRNVWFIPLSGGQSTGPAEDLTALPVRNYKGFLFTFGSKAVLCKLDLLIFPIRQLYEIARIYNMLDTFLAQKQMEE